MEKQDWMEILEQEFQSQTSEQFEKLINECKSNFNDDIKIINIIKNIKRNRTITFNQWKALRAQLSKFNNPKKTI